MGQDAQREVTEFAAGLELEQTRVGGPSDADFGRSSCLRQSATSATSTTQHMAVHSTI